ncbi:EPIDERMAL PATTERNING FACTOR-like protein 2 [Phragmites australis]|uniref:EPIDERMAL PATTERNING FACTOR-like protein 2 n=1 Tax=Phragmites australis TaxID=29695 RepID=UPI002D792CC9|nr:EPIDERMAL PATTERNING FACTOR-like protein 2 [Phragmites australis]
MELLLCSSSLLLLLLLSSQGLQSTEGRALHYQFKDPPKVIQIGKGVSMAEALIGSRPPRCEDKCAPCGRCEAVQVPVAPRVDSRGEAEAGRARLFRAAGDRTVDESYTDYKPLNWKCRCADRRALDP